MNGVRVVVVGSYQWLFDSIGVGELFTTEQAGGNLYLKDSENSAWCIDDEERENFHCGTGCFKAAIETIYV